MPERFIYETAVTIDHELNEMRVDTTRDGVASTLRRLGFREVTQPNSRPYRRFLGEADQLRFRKSKDNRPARGFALKKNAAKHGTMQPTEKNGDQTRRVPA